MFSPVSNSGEWAKKSPILEPDGQPAPGAESGVSAAYCPGLQVWRPAPTEGLTVTPGGRVTTALLVEGVASWNGSEKVSVLFVSWKLKPDGEEAFWSVRNPNAAKSRSRRLHPV